jgi:hypothetical protein
MLSCERASQRLPIRNTFRLLGSAGRCLKWRERHLPGLIRRNHLGSSQVVSDEQTALVSQFSISGSRWGRPRLIAQMKWHGRVYTFRCLVVPRGRQACASRVIEEVEPRPTRLAKSKMKCPSKLMPICVLETERHTP